MFESLKKYLSPKFYVKKLLELKDRPEETARGLALGVFIGFLPINGFQVITAVAIAAFAKVSKVAAAIGTHVTNPWTTVPILILDYWIGVRILSFFGYRIYFSLPHVISVQTIIKSGVNLLVPTFVGGVLLGSVFSVLSYVGFKKFLLSVKDSLPQKQHPAGTESE